MESVTPFDLQRMFFGEHPPLFLLEIVVRVVIIYLFASILLGLMSRRGKREMSPFEYMMIIALGSATGDSMFYPEVPIFYAMMVITIMVGIEEIFAFLQMRFKSFQYFFEGDPTLLIREGKILERSLKKEKLRKCELFGLLREKGIENTGEVQVSFLEISGEISVITYEKGKEVVGESTVSGDLDPWKEKCT